MIEDLQLTLRALNMVVPQLSPQQLKYGEVELFTGQAGNSLAPFLWSHSFILMKKQLLIKHRKLTALYSPFFILSSSFVLLVISKWFELTKRGWRHSIRNSI